MSREQRKDVLKELREKIVIDCSNVYSDRRRTCQHHKFWNCKDADNVVKEIKRVVKELGYTSLTVKKVDWVPPVNSYSIPSTSITIDFPYHTYC